MKTTTTLLAICLFTVTLSQTNKPDFLKKWKDRTLSKKTEVAARKTVDGCLEDSTIFRQWDNDSSFVNTQKTVYGYDAYANLSSEILSSWNNAWQPMLKYTYASDANHNTISSLYQSWNLNTNSWQNSNLALSTYTGQSYLAFSTMQGWNASTNSWKNQSKYSCTYDASYNLLSGLVEEWDTLTNSWRGMYKNTYTYTGNSVTTEVSQEWVYSANALQNFYKISYTYGALNNIIGSCFQLWDNTNSVWMNTSTVTASFSGTLPTLYVQMDWNSSTNTWTNTYKSIYTYDANGNQTSQLDQRWVAASNTWRPEYQYIETYDLNNNLITTVSKMRDTITNLLQNTYRETYAYDSYNNQVYALHEAWDTINSVWINNYNSNNYYDCRTVGIKELPKESKKLILFPNPVQSTFFIDTEMDYVSTQILSVNGQAILSSKENQKTISVSNLESGMYLIQLLDKNQKILATKKFVKE